MEKTELLDAVDMEILRALQKNARLTTKELAAMVNLSTTPVFERVKRLEQRGYVKGYVAVLDAEKLGRGFVVFCSVKMRRIGREIAEDFARVVRRADRDGSCPIMQSIICISIRMHTPFSPAPPCVVPLSVVPAPGQLRGAVAHRTVRWTSGWAGCSNADSR